MALSRIKRAIRHLTGRPIRVWHHTALQVPIAGAEQRIGIDPRRADNVLTWLLARRLISADDVASAPEATWEALLRVHDADYLASLDERDVVARILGVDAAVVATSPVLELWRRGTGATVEALAWVVETGGLAVNLGGGFHHAGPAHGTGFCALNDVAVAVRAARLGGFDGRIAIIDVDAHPPDGIAACIHPEDDGIRLISVGVASQWATPAWVYDHRVPPGSTDTAYLDAVDAALRDLGKPDVVMVLAGSDPLAGDRFGALGCTPEGLVERDERIRDAVNDRPTVLLPAGGYTSGAWRAYAASVAVFMGSRERPKPDFDPVMHRTRRIMRTIDPERLGDDGEWLSGADLAYALGLPSDEPRFLGLITQPGLTYALTRYGLLDTLTRMGFTGLEVDLDTRSVPHLVRITAKVDDEDAVLFEVSAQDRRIGGLDTLFIDWLTLRDPRVPFARDKPRLPGQDAPGLGLGDQALALLHAFGQRANKDALALVPSHFHVAWMVRERFRFLDPVREGRFRALVDATRRQPLHRISDRLDGDGIPTELDQVVTWDPGPMLSPLTKSAHEALSANAAEAQRVYRDLVDALLPV